MRFAMYFIAEYVAMISMSAIAATLFLGGWAGPFNIVSGPWWLFAKMLLFLFLFVWLRATLPRLRYDQLMRLSWSVLLPIALLNVAVTAIIVAAISAGPVGRRAAAEVSLPHWEVISRCSTTRLHC